VRLSHLALLVRDVRRARGFYEKYFGFGDANWVSTDTLFLSNEDDFHLALMRGEHPPNPGAFHHFGFRLDSANEVRQLRARLDADGVPIIEDVQERDLVSFKCTDPDGYTVEVYTELTGS
jgi:catechol 2,3-dioxygenase-like lactoylglutathione lyase family enzyme